MSATDQSLSASERTTAMALDGRGQLVGEALARRDELVAPGAQEVAVAGELERAAHQVLGDRLRRVQVLLQPPLVGDPEALGDQPVTVQRARRARG